MELFFLSSRRKRRSRTSPGTEKIRTWQFLPMPRRFRQIQAALLSARLLDKLRPNPTLFYLLVTNKSHQLISMVVLDPVACAPCGFSRRESLALYPLLDVAAVSSL